jgi:hypothetical protein
LIGFLWFVGWFVSIGMLIQRGNLRSNDVNAFWVILGTLVIWPVFIGMHMEGDK